LLNLGRILVWAEGTMICTDHLQGSRFELKYVINEATARRMKDFALGYLQPDCHADPANNCQYGVHSLYLETPTLQLCKATLRGLKNRYKLRMRFYDLSPESPVFLEVKRRENDVILKSRVPVRRAGADHVLRGYWPRADDLLDRSPKSQTALTQFCRLRDLVGATGRCFVSYQREAYVTPNDDSLRLTFDRRIHGITYRGQKALAMDGPSIYPPVGGVVLEIKFTDHFPRWVADMVRHFGVERRSMAKYVACVLALRPEVKAFFSHSGAGRQRRPHSLEPAV